MSKPSFFRFHKCGCPEESRKGNKPIIVIIFIGFRTKLPSHVLGEGDSQILVCTC